MLAIRDQVARILEDGRDAFIQRKEKCEFFALDRLVANTSDIDD